jgi:hypothetical protein
VIVWPEGVRVADPASDAVIVALAAGLAAAGAGIWLIAARPERPVVTALAAVNAAGAGILLAWLAVTDGFSRPAAALLIAVSTVLLALAAAEMLAPEQVDDAGDPLRTPRES